jgi:uncharacterized protein YaaR (DUF327 family)
MDKKREVVYHLFVGTPLTKDGRKIQSLLYYIFDVGRLGFGSDMKEESFVKCFKNEVSHIMRDLISKYVNTDVIEGTDQDIDNVALMLMIKEALIKRIHELVTYIFTEEEKRMYILKRIEEYTNSLVSLVRNNEIVVK